MKQKGFSNIVLVVIIAIVTLSGGVLARKYFKEKPRIQNQQQIITDEIANWKLYESNFWKFSLKHPPEYIVSSNDPLYIVSSNDPLLGSFAWSNVLQIYATSTPIANYGYFAVGVWNQPTEVNGPIYKTTDDLFQALKNEGRNVEKIDLNDIEAIEELSTPPSLGFNAEKRFADHFIQKVFASVDILEKSVKIIKNGLIYDITIIPHNDPILNKILFSFKFTN